MVKKITSFIKRWWYQLVQFGILNFIVYTFAASAGSMPWWLILLMSNLIMVTALYIFSDPKFIEDAIPQSFVNKDKSIDPILFKMNEVSKEISVYEFDQAAKKQYTAIIECACQGIQFKAILQDGQTLIISDEIIEKAMKSNTLRRIK